MWKLSSLAAGLCLGVGILAAPSLFADDTSYHPMIELGAGTESDFSSGVNVILRVGAGFRRTNGTMMPGDVVTPEQIVVAHISGDLAVYNTDPKSPKIPYADIRFVAKEKIVNVLNQSGNSMYGDLKIVPGSIGRDINLDEALTVRVDVIGAQFEYAKATSEHVAIFAQAAADLLGVKVASHFSDVSTFAGVHIGKINLEAGLSDVVNDNFAIRVSVGGSSDMALWGTRIQSDMKAYVSIKATIYRFISIFLQGGYSGAYDGRGGWASGPEIMGGLSIEF